MEQARLNFDATTESEVFAYYTTRARQMAYHGYVWSKHLIPFSGGFITHFEFNGRTFASFFVTADQRGRGSSNEALDVINGAPVITMPDCNIERYLNVKRVTYTCVTGIHDTEEYKMIEQHYGDRRARRSGMLMMNHIDEGLTIMNRCGASRVAQQAYAIHPLIQDDGDLYDNIQNVAARAHPMAVAYALEYRNIANAYLSHKTVDVIALSPLPAVNAMLVADKVQNRKDFELYHKDTHARSSVLDAYFKRWLERLGVSEEAYQSHVGFLKDCHG